MKSGMLAAEAAYAALAGGSEGRDELTAYPDALNKSWVAKELKMVRNAEPAVAKFGGSWGTLYSGLDLWLHRSASACHGPSAMSPTTSRFRARTTQGRSDRKSTRLNSSH